MNLLAQVPPSAEDINLSPTSGLAADLTGLQVAGIVRAAINLVLILAAVVFFFMLVIGGIKWITSGGDKGGTEVARNQITAALVGLVIVFAAWAIMQLIGGLFGITIFSNLTIPGFT